LAQTVPLSSCEESGPLLGEESSRPVDRPGWLITRRLLIVVVGSFDEHSLIEDGTSADEVWPARCVVL
jgi:hypothetical protein